MLSSGAVDSRVNVVKTTTAPPSSTSDRTDDGGDTGSYVKQGVVKAMETGLDIGEMAKKTLDNVWDATKDTARDDENKYDVPPADHFIDDLRKHAGGYDSRRNN
ncbi:hypothetical protein L1987_78202 [Smallanthus sonchifolius]|uniref:Uncharacterized protein n=1 Tax=Smallanthus sonchifolius TaxID=185202 RepID=A0ACB8ZBT9_9ASTR|nr:hypothetical protein L1987_78202 [Smallanthus sonchifolius]